LTVEVDGVAVSVVSIVQPEVDHIELVDCQAAKVVLDTGAELLGSLSRDPTALVVSVRADLADQHQVRWIGVECGVDQLVRDVRTVVLGSVDVVDTQLNRPAEYSESRVPILGRPSDTGAW
jgi:hypothetical protein